jgi:hypothetical protein
MDTLDTCFTLVQQLCGMYISCVQEEKENVNLGFLKHWVYVPNVMCKSIHLPLKSIQCLSALMVKGIVYDTIHT